MSFKDLLRENSYLIEEVANCKDIIEFEKLVKHNGITDLSQAELEVAWDYIQDVIRRSNQISIDELDYISGGKSDADYVAGGKSNYNDLKRKTKRKNPFGNH